jgi:hypothetical protein
MTDKKPDMAALQKALDDAIEAKRQADHNLSCANSRQCDALNKLNAAQKAFDAAVDAIREANRKYGGDWSQPSERVPPDFRRRHA